MEHILYGCDHYSAKVWALLGCSMTLAISQHTGDYIPNLVLMLLENIFNKRHPSIGFILEMPLLKRYSFSSFKRSNVTSFSITHSCKNHDDEKNYTHVFRLTLSL
jgi:hypothetical protein